jgi:hypothetical protein
MGLLLTSDRFCMALMMTVRHLTAKRGVSVLYAGNHSREWSGSTHQCPERAVSGPVLIPAALAHPPLLRISPSRDHVRCQPPHASCCGMHLSVHLENACRTLLLHRSPSGKKGMVVSFECDNVVFSASAALDGTYFCLARLKRLTSPILDSEVVQRLHYVIAA